MPDEIQSVDAEDIWLNVPEDDMFVGSIFCEDLLVGRIGKLKYNKENHREKSLEIRFGIIPAKNTTI